MIVPIAALLLPLGAPNPACSLAGTPALSQPAAHCREAAQEPAGGGDGPEEDAKLEAWPELPKGSALKKEIARLRKGSSEAMIEESSAAIAELGAGAVPDLLAALGSSTLKGEKHDDAAERIAEALDAVTGLAHTRLIAAEFTHKSPRVRSWALARAGALPDPGTAEAAAAALALAREKPDKDFPDLPYAAAMACASAGNLDGMDLIQARAKDDWGDVGPSVRRAMECVRGDAATELVLDQMAGKDRANQVAYLRLLAGCGTKKALAEVKSHLEGSDNSLRIAAINACRGIVDGEAPIERLSAFQAIEKAKSWAERI